mgnify:CR=1 FL=1
MGITYTISKKRSQRVHGVRDWNQMFRMEPKSDTTQLAVIRARKDRKIVGQAVVTDDWIVFLAVDPKCRGNGIGTKLVSEAEKEIFNNGFEEVKLHPQKEFQDRLIPWYESLGYEIVGFDSNCQEYNMVKTNPKIYKQHPLDESKDYKYKAKVGDFWLQKDVNREWSVCDDEAEADEFESETEPTQIINQMKKDGKVKKDTKYKIVKIKENRNMKKLKEATKVYKPFEDVVEGDIGYDYNGKSVVILDKGPASDFEWAQGYETLEELSVGEDVDEGFPECVLVEMQGEQVLYAYGPHGVVVDTNSDATRVRQISFDFIDNGSLSAEDIISRIQDAMDVAGIEIVGGPSLGDTSWSKEEYGIKN